MVDLKTATLLSNFLFITSLLGVFSCFLIVDKYGRKQLLGLSYLSIGIILLIYALISPVETMGMFWVSYLLLCACIWIIDMTSAPVTWMVYADYIPVKFMSIVVIFFQFCIIISGSFFPVIESNYGINGYFYIIAVIQLVGFMILMKIFIESKGKTHKILWR